MLNLLYHKGNPLITTVADGNLREKRKAVTWEKNARSNYFRSGITMMKS